MQVIGDGAITGGMAYEAMNHAGFLDTNMIVILNDNQQVAQSMKYSAMKHLSQVARLHPPIPQRLLTCPAHYSAWLPAWLPAWPANTTARRVTLPCPACHQTQVSLPTQYNGKNQEPVGALSSTLARLQVLGQGTCTDAVCRDRPAQLALWLCTQQPASAHLRRLPNRSSPSLWRHSGQPATARAA